MVYILILYDIWLKVVVSVMKKGILLTVSSHLFIVCILKCIDCKMPSSVQTVHCCVG